jgi:hypothetical protein
MGDTCPRLKSQRSKHFTHADDGVADLSCQRESNATQLRAHGYPDDGAFVIPSTGTRSVVGTFLAECV